jgi:hypothetical protein
LLGVAGGTLPDGGETAEDVGSGDASVLGGGGGGSVGCGTASAIGALGGAAGGGASTGGGTTTDVVPSAAGGGSGGGGPSETGSDGVVGVSATEGGCGASCPGTDAEIATTTSGVSQTERMRRIGNLQPRRL